VSYKQSKKGRRADLGEPFFRSSWEANIARWLNWRIERGELLSWEHEPRTFTFPALRGAVCYTPDFRVVHADGSEEWLEVKGYETSRDRTKWRRLAKHYPEVKLTVIGPDLYKSIKHRHGGLPHWER
jgi:hypothetical protein